MEDTKTEGGFTGDPAVALAGEPVGVVADPCCGTAAGAQAAGSCCAPAAKAEAVASGTGCCG